MPPAAHLRRRSTCGVPRVVRRSSADSVCSGRDGGDQCPGDEPHAGAEHRSEGRRQDHPALGRRREQRGSADGRGRPSPRSTPRRERGRPSARAGRQPCRTAPCTSRLVSTSRPTKKATMMAISCAVRYVRVRAALMRSCIATVSRVDVATAASMRAEVGHRPLVGDVQRRDNGVGDGVVHLVGEAGQRRTQITALGPYVQGRAPRRGWPAGRREPTCRSPRAGRRWTRAGRAASPPRWPSPRSGRAGAAGWRATRAATVSASRATPTATAATTQPVVHQ